MSQRQRCTTSIHLSASPTLLLSLQFPPMIYLRLLRSIAYTLLCLHLLHILVHKLFTCLPNSLSGCLNLKRNTFSPSHYHLFLKHIDTVAIFVPLLPCLPDHCLNSVSDSLSLKFAPHIHLIILISALCNKGKVKCAILLYWSLGGVLISLPKAMSP